MRRWLPVLAWMTVILIASTEIGSGDRTARWLRSLLVWLNPDSRPPHLVELHFYVRKTAHFVQFAVLTFLLWRVHEPLLHLRRSAFNFRVAGRILAIAAVFAIASETIQIFFPDREASVHDAVIDLVGAFGGLALIFLLKLGRRRTGNSGDG